MFNGLHASNLQHLDSDFMLGKRQLADKTRYFFMSFLKCILRYR